VAVNPSGIAYPFEITIVSAEVNWDLLTSTAVSYLLKPYSTSTGGIYSLVKLILLASIYPLSFQL